jgi:hypothetical protein
MFRVLVFWVISFSVFAQYEPDEIIEQRIIEFGITGNQAIGQHLKKIKSEFASEFSIGFGAAYYINPFKKNDRLSTVFVGLDAGFENARQNDFAKPPVDFNFYANHASFTVRPSVKFLPVILPKANLFSFGIAIGPKRYTSKMFEVVETDEVTKLADLSQFALSYGVSANYERKIKEKSKTYLQLGLVYEGGNNFKTWDRNKLGFTSNYAVISPQLAVLPSVLAIRVRFINYR